MMRFVVGTGRGFHLSIQGVLFDPSYGGAE